MRSTYSLLLLLPMLIDFFPLPKLSKELQSSCQAEKAIIEPKKNLVRFEKFSGSIPFKKKEFSSKLEISSKKATLDKVHQTLFLWEEVLLKHAEHFQLNSTKMRVSLEEDHAFFLHGEKRVLLSLLEKAGSQIEGEEITWDSNQEQIAIYGYPLHLKDESCDLYCKKAYLHYQKEKDSFRTNKITLHGDIKLHYHEEKLDSYGLADSIDFDPETKELILQGERVLFCNAEDSLRISAPKIIIRKGEYVKGIGDVHFSFSEEEKTKFNQQFSKFLHLR